MRLLAGRLDLATRIGPKNDPEKVPRNGTQNRPTGGLVFMQNPLFSLGFCDSGPPGRDPFREHFWIDFWAREARPESRDNDFGRAERAQEFPNKLIW